MSPDVNAIRVKTGAILTLKHIKEYPAYIDLGTDVLIFPEFHSMYGWDQFVKEVTELYKKHTTNKSYPQGEDIQPIDIK